MIVSVGRSRAGISVIRALGRDGFEVLAADHAPARFDGWRWEGPAGAELKIDARDGHAKLIEVNQHLPSYLSFAIRCGLTSALDIRGAIAALTGARSIRSRQPTATRGEGHGDGRLHR